MPLHCAARSGQDAVVDLLLKRGASVKAKTKNGLEPLHMAVQGDHTACVQLLLQHGAAIENVTMVRSCINSIHTLVAITAYTIRKMRVGICVSCIVISLKALEKLNNRVTSFCYKLNEDEFIDCSFENGFRKINSPLLKRLTS